jgi:hypothetical protein
MAKPGFPLNEVVDLWDPGMVHLQQIITSFETHALGKCATHDLLAAVVHIQLLSVFAIVQPFVKQPTPLIFVMELGNHTSRAALRVLALAHEGHVVCTMCRRRSPFTC